MKGRRPLRPEERALWDKVARTVAPLRREDVATPPPAPPPPAAEPAGEKAAPAKPPAPAERPPVRPANDLDRTLRRKLARGGETIEGRIDLHGLTQEEAHAALQRFIPASQAAGRKVVLVITGKGRGGGGEGAGILRRAVPHWLGQRDLSRLVVSFGPAHQRHGGDGALYVRLRSPRRTARR